MKLLYFLSLSIIICSCAFRNFNGPIICQTVPETTTKLTSLSSSAIVDSTAEITIRLQSELTDTYFESTRIKITNRLTKTITGGKADSSGFFSKVVAPGDYTIFINCLESPDLEIDSINVVGGYRQELNVLLGKFSENVMIQTKGK